MCAAAGCSLSKRFRCPMIDAVIEVVIGKCVRYAGEMDDGVALLQQRLPIERYRQIRQRNCDHIRTLKSGRPPRCGYHLVAPSREVRHEMTSQKAAGAGHKYGGLIVHMSERWTGRAAVRLQNSISKLRQSRAVSNQRIRFKHVTTCRYRHTPRAALIDQCAEATC